MSVDSGPTLVSAPSRTTKAAVSGLRRMGTWIALGLATDGRGKAYAAGAFPPTPQIPRLFRDGIDLAGGTTGAGRRRRHDEVSRRLADAVAPDQANRDLGQ